MGSMWEILCENQLEMLPSLINDFHYAKEPHSSHEI